MRPLGVLLWLALPLAAGPAIRVVAVERIGPPPFEDDRRVYRLEGENAAQLKPGEVLQLSRPGDPRDPGRLKVAFLEPGRASAYLESRGATYPLVGDLALSRRMQPVPALPSIHNLPDLSVRPPRLSAPPAASEATPPAALPSSPAEVVPVPPRRESIYFLEGDGSLSPKGRDKLQAAVRAWGAEGRWVIALPEDRLLPDRVRQGRILGIRRALTGFGVGKVEVKDTPRRDGDTGDVAYVEKG
jgi:hypothetical protein